jgi:autotransporter-associated beta strand protein
MGIGLGIRDNFSGGGTLTKTGPGQLTLVGANTYTGLLNLAEGTVGFSGSLAPESSVNIGTAATLDGTGTISGNVTLLGALTNTYGSLTLGSLTWSSNGRLDESLGGATTAPTVTGALTKNGTGPYLIALSDQGAKQFTTYTLMTFGSISGFTASDFTVTGVPGTLALTDNALTFTTNGSVTRYGVALAAIGGKDRATFSIHNTGNTTTTFRLSARQQIIGGSKAGKSSIAITYTLGGANITKPLGKGTAAVTIPADTSVQVVVKAKAAKRLHSQSTIKAALAATSTVHSETTASAQIKLTLTAGRH